MDFMQYIVEQALVIVPVLWVLGALLKRTPMVPDWTIPWVLVAAGIGFAVGTLGLTVEAVIQGILVAGAAVLGHQLVKQTSEKDNVKISDYPPVADLIKDEQYYKRQI